jgi:hypothetical protein
MIVTGTTVTDSSNEKQKSIEHIVGKENFLEQLLENTIQQSTVF